MSKSNIFRVIDNAPPFEWVEPKLEKPVRPHGSITGQWLAKSRLDPAYRAFFAARWMLGALTITTPTARQAGLLFGACEASIRREKRDFEVCTRPASKLVTAWTEATPAERETFARAVLADLWDLIAHITR